MQDIGKKLYLLIIVNAIRNFLDYCIQEKVQPKLEDIQKHLKDKIGVDLGIGVLTFIIEALVNNSGMAIMLLLNELCEYITDDMLDKPSVMWSKFTELFGG